MKMTTKKVLFDKYFQFFVNVTQRCRLHSPLSVTHTLYNTQGNIYSMYMITALLYYTYFLDIISQCDVLYMFTFVHRFDGYFFYVQVSLQDGGSYFCSAENGLGHTEKQELVLDVQYGPQVVYFIKNVSKKISLYVLCIFHFIT